MLDSNFSLDSAFGLYLFWKAFVKTEHISWDLHRSKQVLNQVVLYFTACNPSIVFSSCTTAWLILSFWPAIRSWSSSKGICYSWLCIYVADVPVQYLELVPVELSQFSDFSQFIAFVLWRLSFNVLDFLSWYIANLMSTFLPSSRWTVKTLHSTI